MMRRPIGVVLGVLLCSLFVAVPALRAQPSPAASPLQIGPGPEARLVALAQLQVICDMGLSVLTQQDELMNTGVLNPHAALACMVRTARVVMERIFVVTLRYVSTIPEKQRQEVAHHALELRLIEKQYRKLLSSGAPIDSTSAAAFLVGARSLVDRIREASLSGAPPWMIGRS